MRLDVQAGPDAGRAVDLAPGRHVLGRARSAQVPVADPALEPHHLMVIVGAGRQVEVVQLSGRLAITVDGAPHVAGPVRAGAVLEAGATRVQLGTAEASASPGVGYPVLAAVERETYLVRARSPWVVTLGWGSVRLPMPVDPAGLAFPDHAAAAAAEVHPDMPVFADLGPRRRHVLAVRGPGAEHLIAALVTQLPAADTRRVRVGNPQALAVDLHPVTILVPLQAHDDLPAECHALIELGALWRATYVADLGNPGLAPVRLHAAGSATPPLAAVRVDVAPVADEGDLTRRVPVVDPARPGGVDGDRTVVVGRPLRAVVG